MRSETVLAAALLTQNRTAKATAAVIRFAAWSARGRATARASEAVPAPLIRAIRSIRLSERTIPPIPAA